jgi:glycosyltransferase involved in cell wall biosynthesis
LGAGIRLTGQGASSGDRVTKTVRAALRQRCPIRYLVRERQAELRWAMGQSRRRGEATVGVRRNERGAVMMVCKFAAHYSGNFLSAQFCVGRAIRDRLGLDCWFVLPERASSRAWLADIKEAGFQYAFLPATRVDRPQALLRYARLARARIIHSHFAGFDLECLYAGRKTGAAVIWHVHNGLLDYPIRQRASDVVKARILSRTCDRVVACSRPVERDLIRRGFPRSKVEVVTNALVLDRLGGPIVDRTTMRNRLGIGHDTLAVVSFCWPPDRKGADVLARALIQLQDESPGRVKGVIVGDAALRSFLTDRIGGLPPSLMVIPPVDDVPSLFAAADVFVSAAREEGYSFAIGEAMACSLPVVGSDIVGTSHYWDAPGFLRYPVEDSEALAGRLRELMTLSGRKLLGTQNQSWAFGHLGIEAHVAALIDLYRRLLDAQVHPRQCTGHG